MNRIHRFAGETAEVATVALKKFWHELWKSLKIFLTYGELREDGSQCLENETSGVRQVQLIHGAKFNGLVTSLQMFVLLTTVIVLLFIAPFFASDSFQLSTKLALIVFMSLGGVIMLIFNRHQDNIFINTRKKSLGVRGQLVLIGIVIFFVLGSFLDLFYIIFHVHCLPVYIKCNTKAMIENLTSLAFHCIRMIYLAGQTAFCTCYRGLRFKDKCLTRYGLMFLQAANLAVWFDILLRQTSSKLQISLFPSYINDCINVTSSEPKYLLGCVSLNGTFNGMIRGYGNNIIYPFLFQFSLLVLECFVHWFVQCGKVESCQNQDQSVVPRDRTSSYCFATDDKYSLQSLHVDEQKNYSGMVRKYFVIITFMNILFVMFNFLPMLVEPEEMLRFSKISSIYCSIYWFINILLTFLGYYCTTAFKDNPKKKTFKSLNYLLIISAIGPYIYIVTALETITLIDQELDEPKGLTVLKEVTFFLSVFCQIPFCFMAGRVVLPSRNHEHKFRVNCFKAITLHMAVSNCVLWIVDSFLGAFNIKYEDSALQMKYYRKSSWLFINNIVQPLSVFFRFNSFLLFTAAHVRMTPLFSYKVRHVD